MNNFKFCWHFGFPFADVDCDAFLNPVTPAPVLLSAVSQSLDRPVPGLRLRSALSVSLSLASDAASWGHPLIPGDWLRTLIKFSQQKLDLIAHWYCCDKRNTQLNTVICWLSTDRCVFMEMNVTCLKTSYLESKFLCCYFYYDSNARTDTAGIDREWVERGAERGKRDRITVTRSLKIGDTLELIRWCDMLQNPSDQLQTFVSSNCHENG